MRDIIARDRVTALNATWRLTVLGLAVAAWLFSFVLLLRFNTWTPFALGGGMLAALALASDPRAGELLRPSTGRAGLGLVSGLVMVVLTHLAHATLAPASSEIKKVRTIERRKVVGQRRSKVYEVGDGFVVAQVTSRHKPSDQEFAAEKEHLTDEARKAKGYELQEGYLESLRKAAKIEEYPTVIQKISSRS